MRVLRRRALPSAATLIPAELFFSGESLERDRSSPPSSPSSFFPRETASRLFSLAFSFFGEGKSPSSSSRPLAEERGDNKHFSPRKRNRRLLRHLLCHRQLCRAIRRRWKRMLVRTR